MLNDEQLKFIAEVLGNLGLVLLASVVVPALMQDEDIYLILSGALYILLCWIIGVFILNYVEKEE